MKKNFKIVLLSVVLVLAVFAFGACATEGEADIVDMSVYLGEEFESVPLSSAPALNTLLMPAASGISTYGNQSVTIDASNTAQGYIMINYSEYTSSKIKAIIEGPNGTKYTYDIKKIGSYEAFPLSDGNGTYKVGIYKNTEGTKYSTVYSTSFSVTLNSVFAPFLLPNQFVDYNANSLCVLKAAELAANCSTEMEKISAFYDYVTTNFTYDYNLAATVTSGYLPNLDSIMNKKSGICFDYAAVMTAMLRSQGIPCKLIVGYAGTTYHAWINAYSSSAGWMNAVIYFDGSNWKLMDPTYASSGGSSIIDYINNPSNYSAKYQY